MWEFVLIAWLNGAIIFQTKHLFEDKVTCNRYQVHIQKRWDKLNEDKPKDSLYEITKCVPANKSKKKGKVKGWSI